MATTKPAAKKSTSTAVAKWDEELARQAQVAAGMEETTASGQFFSTRGGQLSFNDSPLPHNEMAVILLDGILETVYYPGKYDPDTPQGPAAFAFGRDPDTMTWHENSIPEYAGKLCQGSDICEWGSADTGKGKAARETRRLAMIPAGTFDRNGEFTAFDDEKHFDTATIAYMRLPVTSVKGYSAYVKQVTGALKRPPHAVFTRVSVVPDAKTQFKVVFEALGQVPNELMSSIMARHEEAVASIDFPYEPYEEQEAPKRGTRAAAKPVGNKAAKPAARRKY